MTNESGTEGRICATCCVQCGVGLVRIPAAVVFPWGAEPVCSEKCFLGAMQRSRDVVLLSCTNGTFDRKEFS